MIPASFDYARASSAEEAVELLAQGGEDAKFIAGGHSLLPLMKLRLAFPTLLVDISRLEDLRGISQANGGWKIGALTRHADLQTRSELGVVAHAAGTIADQQVRNRGTIGGSLAHGDPASDLPAVMLAVEATVVARGSGGERQIAAADLFTEFLETSLAPDELITEVHIPAQDGWGFGYQKFTRRAEDWAMVGVCALVRKGADGSCEDVRVGLTNMGPTPLRARAVEDALRGGSLDAEAIAAAAEHAGEGTSPSGDLNATPEYKQHLARVLVRRAVTEAAA